jgi:hypothetical protein
MIACEGYVRGELTRWSSLVFLLLISDASDRLDLLKGKGCMGSQAVGSNQYGAVRGPLSEVFVRKEQDSTTAHHAHIYCTCQFHTAHAMM